jgi:hypothetical protein
VLVELEGQPGWAAALTPLSVDWMIVTALEPSRLSVPSDSMPSAVSSFTPSESYVRFMHDSLGTVIPSQGVSAYYAAMTDDSDGAPPAEVGQEPLEEFRALVRAAFEQAQSSGKQNWDEMTSAVLKNRLLNLTDREFSENRYGSPSFIHLVRRVPDLLSVEDDYPPFRLKIRAPLVNQSAVDSSSGSLPPSADVDSFSAPARGDWPKTRIRDDLWRAVVDYGSRATYVLDPETGLARPKEAEDGDFPEIPTVSAEEVRAWRQEFFDSLSELTQTRFGDELREWLDGRGRQSDLPRPVRGRWAEYFKRHIAAILFDWFRAHGGPPNDMFVDSVPRNLPPSEAIDELVRTRQLRDLIIRAARTMTYEELSQVHIPASALLHLWGGRQRHGS